MNLLMMVYLSWLNKDNKERFVKSVNVMVLVNVCIQIMMLKRLLLRV